MNISLPGSWTLISFKLKGAGKIKTTGRTHDSALLNRLGLITVQASHTFCFTYPLFNRDYLLLKRDGQP